MAQKQSHFFRASFGGSVAVAGGVLTIGNSYNNTFKGVILKNIQTLTKQAAVAETAAVHTVTVTRAANATYVLAVGQKVDDFSGAFVNAVVRYTSDANGASGRGVVDGIVALLNALGRFKFTAAYASDTTFTITTDAGYPTISSKVVSTNLSRALTTPGVVAVNTAAKLLAEGYEGPVAGRTYTSYKGLMAVPLAGTLAGTGSFEVVECELFIDAGETATVTALEKVIQTPVVTSIDGSGVISTELQEVVTLLA
jgi:hypothetical protein